MGSSLEGKVVFVAGGSRGIGLSIAESCLVEGASVSLTARTPDTLESAHKRLADRFGSARVWSMAGDMRDTKCVEDAIAGTEAALGPIYGAVANAGVHPCSNGIEVGDEMWDAGFLQNLGTTWRVARAAMRQMIKTQGGSIVLISSIAGLNAMGSPLTYGSAKAAVNHLAKELATLGGSKGVRVNAIAPGNIIFPGGTWEERMNSPRAETWQRWIEREVPQRRFGRPEEIGDVAAFLLSPKASFVNGAILPVDGGQSA